MTMLSFDISRFHTDALRGLAYALALAAGEMPTRGEKRSLYLQLGCCIRELKDRVGGGDVSELEEMREHIRVRIEEMRVKPAAEVARGRGHEVHPNFPSQVPKARPGSAGARQIELRKLRGW